MAEILISLTIIGIIAAITLPALQANINEKTWATKRKALYSRMSQAIGMMPSLNGYGVVFEDGSINETATASKAAQAFITDGLSKVLKISNVCDGSTADSLKKCGFPEKITKMGINSKIDTPLTIRNLNWQFTTPNGTNVKYSQINTNSAAFETVNGESILTFYNPNCSYTYGFNGKTNKQNLLQPTMCANFIYDLNGRKGPNQVGKDIGFMTAFYPADSEFVMPHPMGHILIKSGNSGAPAIFSIGYGNQRCRKQYGDDARMANINELKSIYINTNFGYVASYAPYFLMLTGYISSTMYSNSSVYWISPYSGAIDTASLKYNSESYAYIFCVK